MATKEIANRENKPTAVNQNPDMCIVGNAVVPFDISRDLSHSVKHSPNVNAKGVPVITVNSVIQGVVGNAGVGVTSGVSQGAGFVVVTSGATSVNTNQLNTARHLSDCQLNCPGPVGTNGTNGKLYISQAAPVEPVKPKLPCNQPPKTSPRLDELKALKKKLAGMDPDQIDEYVRLGDADKITSGWIDGLNPGKDANPWLRDKAGEARAVLGFGKDMALALSGLAVWAAKKLTVGGRIHNTIDDAILAEDIRLGNVCWGSVKDTAGKVADKLIEPITEPWKKGEFAEAVTRAGLELLSLGSVVGEVAKALEVARAARALEIARAAELEKLAEAERAAAVLNAEKAAEVKPIAEGVTVAKKATAPISKFSDYIFKEGATHGKDKPFRNLGYGRENSEELARMWEKQAAEKVANGEYTLKDAADQYGQRINVEIQVPGIGDAAGKTSYMRSGWMLQPNGSITLNTPFSGFTR